RVTSSDYDNGAPHNIFDLPLERRKEMAAQMWGPRLAPYLRDPFIKAVENPMEFRHRLLGNASKTMFLLVPLFAFVSSIAFRRAGRVYLEQLVLALHIHSFAFVVAAVAAVLSSEGPPSFVFAGD